ncbi:HDOD domain-containing protein [Vibrio aerogenes]|nr:HDOD domain-containing protein [Vibrio aerogenes]
MNHVSFFWLPTDQQELFQAVETEFAQMVESSIQSGKFELPPIPHVVLDIQKLCLQESTTIADVADSLINDPSLTAVVLRVANSVIFNSRGITYSDINTAVSRLGIYRVRDIVTAQAIKQLKYSVHLRDECVQILRQSATNSRKLCAAMVLVIKSFQEIDPETYAYLEHDKALLVGLLADIGLFCLLNEYHNYLEQGNYLEHNLAMRIFESRCDRTSYYVLKTWGFDNDYLSVATSKEVSEKEHDVSYLDIAKIAYHLLLFRDQDSDIDEHEVEINTTGAEVLYQLSNLSDSEFNTQISSIIHSSGF